MRERIDDSISNFKYSIIEKFTLFFSIGFLVLNLLIFSLVMSEARMISLVLAGIFFIYIPIGFFDKEERIWLICSRVLEILTSISLSLAYILLFGKFWLLFLPALEIAAAVLFYLYVYRSAFDDSPKPLD